MGLHAKITSHLLKLTLFCLLIIGSKAWGQERGSYRRANNSQRSSNQDFPHKNLLAISQGISSPAVTSSTLISNNFGRENPVNVAFVKRYRTSLALDLGDGFGFGGDFGWGDSNYGVSVGYRRPSCEECSGHPRGQIGAQWNNLGLGLGIARGLYTLGVLFNGRGKNRIGFLAEIDNGTFFAGRSVFGAGYSYVNSNLTVSLEGTYANFDGQGSSIKMSPGVSIRIRQIAVTLNYDLFISDFEKRVDHGWFGVGYTLKDDFHFALYVSYVNDWTLSGSYFF